jgi:hypothetical protein
MSKVFYISLILLLSTVVMAPLSLYYTNRAAAGHSASALTRDFRLLDGAYFATSLVISAFFFGYRFWEHLAWPVAATSVEAVYLAFAWALLFSFYSDPIGFFQSRDGLWLALPDPDAVYRQYRCCGFPRADAPAQCGDRPPCARAVARAMLQGLLARAATHIALAALHVGAIAAMWLTHALGGIEFDRPPARPGYTGFAGGATMGGVRSLPS